MSGKFGFMKLIATAVAVLVGGGILLLGVRSSSPPPLQILPENRIPVRSTGESRFFFLRAEVNRLADNWFPQRSEPNETPPASPSPQTVSATESATVPGNDSPGDAELPKFLAAEEEPEENPDDLHLRKMASRFAYVEFKGVIGGRRLASFCVDPKSGKCEVVAEGDSFQEVRIEKIDPESVLLTYRSAKPIRKPRVSLEVEYKPMSELTPEERKLREIRYRELYGNRFEAASFEYRRKNGGKRYDPPSPQEQQVSAEIYQQTYGTFFREIQQGTAARDNRDYPLNAPTLEESVAEYFETYWPNQVEWEVGDPNENGGGESSD